MNLFVGKVTFEKFVFQPNLFYATMLEVKLLTPAKCLRDITEFTRN